MSITNLSAHELRELISRYQSELRKLEFQAHKTYSTIKELEDAFFQSTGRTQQPPNLPGSKTSASTPTQQASEARPQKKQEVSEPIERPSVSGRRSSSKPAMARAVEEASMPKAKKSEPATAEYAILPKKTPKKPKKTGGKGKRKRVVKTDGYRLSDWDEFILGSLKDQGIILRNADFYELAKDWVKKKKMKLDKTEIRGKISRSIHKLANKRGDIIKVKYPGRGNAYALPEWFTEDGKLKQVHSA